MEFELVEWTAPGEDKRPQLSDMSEWERQYTIREAYAEKDFRECEEHKWELSIEFGHISIQCLSCLGFYSEINPDYVDDLCFSAPIYRLEYTQDKDSYSGEVNDFWLEAE